MTRTVSCLVGATAGSDPRPCPHLPLTFVGKRPDALRQIRVRPIRLQRSDVFERPGSVQVFAGTHLPDVAAGIYDIQAITHLHSLPKTIDVHGADPPERHVSHAPAWIFKMT